MSIPIEIIVSNPPYVSLDEYKNLEDEIRLFEPKIALTDNLEGFKFYEKIFSLFDNGNECEFIFMELSGTRPDEIISLAKQFNFANVDVFKDLNNMSRVLQIQVR